MSRGMYLDPQGDGLATTDGVVVVSGYTKDRMDRGERN